MKKILFITMAAAAVLSGCAKSDVAEDNGVLDAFTGVLESESAIWNSADEVSINGIAYTVSSGEGTASASFAKKDSGASEPASGFKAFYADGAGSVSWDGEKYALPASYSYRQGKANMPMYAESGSRDLKFKNLCGVLKLSLTTRTADNVSAIVVTSSAGRLNGRFTADADGNLAFCAKTITDEDRQVALDFASPVTLGETATVFYIPVAPGTHKLSVKVYDGDSTPSTIEMPEAFTFGRNVICTLSDAARLYTGAKPAGAR